MFLLPGACPPRSIQQSAVLLMMCLAPRRKSVLCHPIQFGPIDANRALVLKFLSPIFDNLKLIVPRIVVLEKLKHKICAI